MPRFRMNGAVHFLRLFAFIAWTRTTLPFHLFLCGKTSLCELSWTGMTAYIISLTFLYVITFLLYTHVNFSVMTGNAAWNYFPKFCHCIIILMWMLSGDSKWGPFREIFICDFKLPQWCKWDPCSSGDKKIRMRPKQVSMVKVLMLEFVHIPANFGN